MGSSSGRPHQPIRYFLHAQFTVTRMVSWCDAEFGFSPDLVNWVGTLAVWGCSDGRRQRTKHLGHIHSQIPRHAHLDRLHCTHLTLILYIHCRIYMSCLYFLSFIYSYWDRPLFLISVLWWSHGHHCDLRKMLVLSTQVGVDNSPFTPSQKSSSH